MLKGIFAVKQDRKKKCEESKEENEEESAMIEDWSLWKGANVKILKADS